MTRINNFFQNIVAASQREEGQGTVEYVLITGLLAVVVAAAAIFGLVPAVTTEITNAVTAIAAA